MSTPAILLVFFFTSLKLCAETSESHNFTTYDTTYNGSFGSWQIRISRPVNMFTPGNPDTASRPAIITQPGIGEQGNTNPGNLTTYGPHWWLENGWDGSVVLGNGVHYPILITVAYINNQWPSPEAGADVVAFLLSHYHIKRNSVHLGGLSQGAFVWTAMIAYEASPGAETGMSLPTSITALEGFALGQDAPYSSWSRGDAAYQVWATKYHGKYFGLEGTADYRNVAEGEKDMNAVVPGSAHFSYENIGGGAHCCWNSMYDPNQMNWQSYAPYGTDVATGADTNSRGDYRGGSIFQWMLRQGDTSIVGSSTVSAPRAAPTASAGSNQSITLPANTVTLSGSGAEQGGTIAGYSWTLLSGPSQVTYSNPNIATPAVSNLVAGLYTFQLTVTDSYGVTAQARTNVTVNPPLSGSSGIPVGGVWLPGLIQAESYNSMNSVGTEATTDAGGGLDVGWIYDGSWMSYNVDVASAGTYVFTFWLATPYDGAAFQVQDRNGAVLSTVCMKNTGGFQNWANVTATVNLPAGQQVLKLVSISQANWNIDWFQCQPGSYAGGYAIPGLVQGENYLQASGVQTEPAGDVGGGLDVGWIDRWDWMDYAVNVATAGVYTFNFRVATPYAGASFAVQDGFGNIYTSVNVPATGAFQTYTTVSVNIAMTTGPQVLRLTSTSVASWNLNWIEANLIYSVYGSSADAPAAASATGARVAIDAATQDSAFASVRLHPNPVQDMLLVDLNNAFAGPLLVQVLSPSGTLLRTVEVEKAINALQVQVPMTGLPAGVYLVRIGGSGWQVIRKVVKL